MLAFLNTKEVDASMLLIVIVVDDQLTEASLPPSTLYLTVGVYDVVVAVKTTSVIL